MATFSKEGVIGILNSARLKKLRLTGKLKNLGTKPMIAIGATAGLGLWLATRAICSKKFQQGDD